jgi:hypothetical protein
MNESAVILAALFVAGMMGLMLAILVRGAREPPPSA